MLSCLKTTFYQEKKEALIQGMIENPIGVKCYKMEHYLNTQFCDLVRSRKKNDCPFISGQLSGYGRLGPSSYSLLVLPGFIFFIAYREQFTLKSDGGSQSSVK